MSHIAIIKIGFNEYALPPKVDAAKILAAISQGKLVDSCFYDGNEVFFPKEGDISRHQSDLTLRYIDSTDFAKSNPKSGPLRLTS